MTGTGYEVHMTSDGFDGNLLLEARVTKFGSMFLFVSIKFFPCLVQANNKMLFDKSKALSTFWLSLYCTV